MEEKESKKYKILKSIGVTVLIGVTCYALVKERKSLKQMKILEGQLLNEQAQNKGLLKTIQEQAYNMGKIAGKKKLN